MNGPQDLGGMMGFGPISPEIDEPVFHAEWEKRALAITLAAAALGEWNLDMGRHARESLHPAIYYSASYYEIWTRALAIMLMERKMISAEELAQGHALYPPVATQNPCAHAGQIEKGLAAGTPYTRPAKGPARFKTGDVVSTRQIHPKTHTRLPRYARGKQGVIEAVHGVFVFPDSHAHGLGEDPHWCYSVCFRAQDLWGESADPTVQVNVDCWEPYLQGVAA